MTPERSANWKWWVCGALLLATFLNYMDRQVLAVTLPELKRAYNLHEARNGWLEGCFGVAFAVGSLGFGVLVDWFGPRRVYPVVLAGWSLAGVATGFAASPWAISWMEQPQINAVAAQLRFAWMLEPGGEPGTGTFRWLLLCRTLLGVFEAGHWPCALVTARQVLAANDRALGNGILQSGASLGAVVIPLYLQGIESFGGGWELVFWSVGVVGLMWVPLWLVLVRPGDLAHSGASQPETVSVTDPPFSASFFRQLAVLAVIVSSLAVSWQFLRAWLPLYLEDSQGYTPFETRIAVAGYFIVADVGCILAGVLIKYLVARGKNVHAARVGTFAVFTFLTATAAVVPLLGGGPFVLVGLLLAGAGILGLHPINQALTQDLPARKLGLLCGFLSFLAWLVSSVNQVQLGAHIRATKSYDLGLTIAGLAPFVGFLALAAFWPSKNARRRAE